MKFNNNLIFGVTHPDVLELQKFLNKDPDTQVAVWGAGSPGKETYYFGELTRDAVSRFQAKWGISPASGIFGPRTRNLMNNMQSSSQPDLIIEEISKRINTDFTDDTMVPDEVACAQAVTTLMRFIDPEIPVIPGTATLERFVKNSPKFAQIPEPERGCLAIAATGTNTRPDIIPHGHTWFFLDNYLMVSNNSYTGLFQQNYNLDTARARYETKGGYTINFYRKVA